MKKSWRDANYDDICRMGRDSVGFGDFSIMTDGETVALSEQAMGEWPTQGIKLPKRVFNRMIDAYLFERKLTPKKRKQEKR